MRRVVAPQNVVLSATSVVSQKWCREHQDAENCRKETHGIKEEEVGAEAISKVT